MQTARMSLMEKPTVLQQTRVQDWIGLSSRRSDMFFVSTHTIPNPSPWHRMAKHVQQPRGVFRNVDVW